MKVSTKKFRKYAGKAIKKVPKKKLINKAATYGLKKVIGGPYLDIFNLFYKKTKKKALSYAGSYAYDSFFRSKFAREKINTIPMSIIALIIRSASNFLVFSKLRTGIHWLDFIISMIITILVTILSPLFYTSISAHEEGFMTYTNNFVDNFLGPNGWEYVENIKNRLVLTLGITLIIILQFVNVSSRSLQELIVHTLITGYISEQILEWIDSLLVNRRNNLTETMITKSEIELAVVPDKMNIEEDVEHQITVLYIGMEYINHETQYIIPAVLPIRKAKRCHTKNRVFRGRFVPLKAKIIPRDKIRDYFNKNKIIPTEKTYEPLILTIVENYPDKSYHEK